MEKIRKQITINCLLVVVSVLVIFISKTWSVGKILSYREYLGTDIIFVMITSLVTTIGWRFAENIVGHWVYNVIIALVLFFFTFEYGTAVSTTNNILTTSIVISLVVFLLVYIVENILIIFHFWEINKIDKPKDKLSYQENQCEVIV